MSYDIIFSMLIADNCPRCHTLDPKRELFELVELPYPFYLRAYDKFAKAWNRVASIITDLLHGCVYDSSYPRWLNKITSRTRLCLSFCLAHRLVPRLPYSKPYRHIEFRCNVCGWTTEDHYDFTRFIHLDDPVELEELRSVVGESEFREIMKQAEVAGEAGEEVIP